MLSSIDVMASDKVTEVRLLHPLKAELPILVTPFGITTEDNALQP